MTLSPRPRETPRVPDAIKLSSPDTREFWEIPVLFEDEYLLALDKPAGLLTSPDRYDPERPSLMKLLHAAIAAGKPWARTRGLRYLANAHRLELGTSGVILLAKTKTVLIALANLFGAEKPQKTYVALIQGAPAEERFEVDAPLAPFPGRPGVMRVGPLIAGIALHAEQLALAHPVTSEPLSITAPWPKDLTVAVKYLRRYAAR